MKEINKTESQKELDVLCNLVRELMEQGEYRKCELLIKDAMGKYPHAPQPHNLIGIMLEKEGDHVGAMKHFRAAWALDPTYIPARCNMERFGSIYANDKCAFDESDCL